MTELERAVFEIIRAQMRPALGIDSSKDKLDLQTVQQAEHEDSCALSRIINGNSMNSMHLERLTWKPTGNRKRYMMRSWYRQRMSMPLLPHRLNRYKAITRQG